MVSRQKAEGRRQKAGVWDGWDVGFRVLCADWRKKDRIYILFWHIAMRSLYKASNLGQRLPDQGQIEKNLGQQLPYQGHKASNLGQRLSDQGQIEKYLGQNHSDQGHKASDLGQQLPDQGQIQKYQGQKLSDLRHLLADRRDKDADPASN